MRISRLFMAVFVLLGVSATPAVSQVPTWDLYFQGPNNVAGPYTARLGGPAGSRLDVYCVDFYHDIQIGQNWTANVSVLSGSLALTRGGVRYGDAQARVYYTMAAWLTTQYSSYGTGYWNGIQGAIWTIMGAQLNSYYYGPVTDPTKSDYWIQLASSNWPTIQNVIDLDDWLVLTDVRMDPVTGTGGVQEYLTAVPEPSTVFLLGTGLIGLGAVGYRRKRGLKS